MSLTVIHIFSCLWVFISKLSEADENTATWINSNINEKKTTASELYLLSAYVVVTTMTTVGYGDISPVNALEQIFGILLMVLGVIAFSFASASLASILSNYDV
jgi:hypothetical protein